MYRVARSQRTIRVVGGLLARLAGRRLRARTLEVGPDAVVSAYPIVSAAIAGVRRRQQWPYPTAALVTDFDPHPGWIHPDLDANLVVGFAQDGTRPVRPPIATPLPHADTRAAVRRELGVAPATRVVLIVGGAWGVGNLHGAACAAAAARNTRVIVCAGHNDRVARELRDDPLLEDATILGFSSRLPELMAASDVLIQNAGGMTCLEAFGARLPVVMFEPIPGHGEDNTAIMARAGLVTAAASTDVLRALLDSDQFWELQAPLTAGRAEALFARESAGAHVAALITTGMSGSGTPVAHLRGRRRRFARSE